MLIKGERPIRRKKIDQINSSQSSIFRLIIIDYVIEPSMYQLREKKKLKTFSWMEEKTIWKTINDAFNFSELICILFLLKYEITWQDLVTFRYARKNIDVIGSRGVARPCESCKFTRIKYGTKYCLSTNILNCIYS